MNASRSLPPVIIQATNIAPLRGKHLLPLVEGRTVIEVLIDRLRGIWHDDICVATSDLPDDDALCAHVTALGAHVVRGPHRDLVKRLILAAEAMHCDHFVRVMGAAPFVCIPRLADLAAEHAERGVEFSYNEHRMGVPRGLGGQVVSVDMLKRLDAADISAEVRQEFAYSVLQNAEHFAVHRQDSDLPRLALDFHLETTKDLSLLREIAVNVPDVTIEAIIDYAAQHPALHTLSRAFPPKEVGLEKLFLHPEKILALTSQNGLPDASFPVSVELSLTNRCNLACVWCSDKDLRGRQGVKATLTLDTVRRLTHELREGRTKGIVIEGGGEPTLHPDFAAIVACITDAGMGAGLITNGVVTLPPDVLRRLDWVRVSLDSSTRAEFQNAKGRDAFETVMGNIAHFARHCPTVGIGYVVTRHNTEHLESLVLRARQAKASYIQFRPVIDAPDIAPEDFNLDYLKLFETDGFCVNTDAMRDNQVRGNSNLPCRAHPLTSVIGADGSVHLCGRLNIFDWFEPIGNINEQSFGDIWRGAKRKSAAKALADPGFCGQWCPECRITKFNQLLWRLSQSRTRNFI